MRVSKKGRKGTVDEISELDENLQTSVSGEPAKSRTTGKRGRARVTPPRKRGRPRAQVNEGREGDGEDDDVEMDDGQPESAQFVPGDPLSLFPAELADQPQPADAFAQMPYFNHSEFQSGSMQVQQPLSFATEYNPPFTY